MSRYNNYALQHPSSVISSNSFSPTLTNEKHEELESGSEDGTYALYPDAVKNEPEYEDDSNTALTTQTLNADGTPKRPMNAFMIFARRRRPQVSAENQAMRTGEISKILSKEWVSMSPSDKQFYLEQAKQLKETFNSRYPDYVYRRRPNNSRKRRRSDAGSLRSADQALLGDHADDAASVDLEASPIDGDDQLEATLPPSYSRTPYAMSHSIGEHGKYGSQSRASGHQVSIEPPFRQSSQHESRLSYSGSGGNSERMAPSMGSNASTRMPIGHDGLGFSYGQQGASQSSSNFGTDSVSSHQGWSSRVDRITPAWLGNQESRASGKQSPYASANPASPWSNSSDHPPSQTANHNSSSSNYFPTLNTPFYPSGQSNMSPYSQNISTSPIPPHSPTYDQLNHMQHTSMPRDFSSPRGYTPSSSLPSQSYPARDSLFYGQRNLPSVQSGYPQLQTPAPSNSGSGHASSTYWTRE